LIGRKSLGVLILNEYAMPLSAMQRARGSPRDDFSAWLNAISDWLEPPTTGNFTACLTAPS
jgi:hypothetical protein